MNAGPGRAEGSRARPRILTQLEAELRQAEGCFEYQRAAELRAQIARLSAGTPANPSRETTGRPAARKRTR